MYTMLTVAALAHFIYLCRSIDIDNRIDSDAGNVGIVENGFLMSMPLRYLLLDGNQRREAYKPGLVFPTSSKQWLSNSIPNNLSAILVLLTFGMFAPLLAIIIIVCIVMKSVVHQLVIGRFLVRELGVIKQHMHTTRGSSHIYHPSQLYIAPATLDSASFQLLVKEAAEPWGAIAAVSHINTLCSEVPRSIFHGSRDIYAFFTSISLSFIVNDIYNSERDTDAYGAWPSIVVLSVPPLWTLILWLYFRNTKQVATTHNPDDVTDHIPKTVNPLQQKTTSAVSSTGTEKKATHEFEL